MRCCSGTRLARSATRSAYPSRASTPRGPCEAAGLGNVLAPQVGGELQRVHRSGTRRRPPPGSSSRAGPRRGLGHSPATAASRACSSASTQEPITASRSPSRTWSRLYALNPVRWSLSRFSGVVGADPLAAVDRPHLAAAGGGRLGLRLLLGRLVEPRPQDPHGGLLVLQLRLLVLAGHDDAGRQMGDPDRGVGRVDALPTGPEER